MRSMHSSARSFVDAVVVSCAVVVFIAGCHSTPKPPTPPPTSSANVNVGQWPEKLADFRFRWTAEPGIDLTAGNAVPLRAYLESWLVVHYTDDVQFGYPGFQRATPPPIAMGSPDVLDTPYAQREIRESRGRSLFNDPGQRIVGNEELHLLRMEPLANGFRAFLCDATFNAYKQAPGATQYVPIMSSPGVQPTDVENMAVWRIEFSDKDPRVGATPPAAPAVSQEGPLPAPRDDVFGPWFVTGAYHVGGWVDSDHPGLKPGTPEYDQPFREAQDAERAMRQQCLDRYPLNADERADRGSAVLDSAPPVEPADPGWPE